MVEHKTAYGVDLAGYSSAGKSQVAKVSLVENNGECYINASLIQTDLLQERKSSASLIDVVNADVKVFKELLSEGICAVDVPIDLQGLNEFIGYEKYVWVATRRPIDFALGALPPLADRIGAVVARMQLIIKHFPNALGKTIFETYPAGSLQLLGIKQQYKGGKTLWQGGKWSPVETNRQEDIKKNNGLTNLCKDLGFMYIEDRIILTDDQFDAIISAIPLLSPPVLIESELAYRPLIAKKGPIILPKGYILCGTRFWSKIEIHKADDC